MSARDGGPAFPDPGRGQSAKQRESLTDKGMSLRDYFAAQAMQALILQGAEIIEHHPQGKLIRPARQAVPSLAYQYADAMIAAREST